MQIQFNNDFANGGQIFTQAEKDSFLADERFAINIFNATFTNNITLTLNIGFGSLNGETLAKQDGGQGNLNFDAAVLLTYSQLQDDLLTFGQPNFFTTANLPEGDSINGESNFWVSSSVGAVFGQTAPNRPPNAPDGYVGIGTSITPGPLRISAFLHEIGHALGRGTGPFRPQVNPQGITYVSALDLVRFSPSGNRLFLGAPPPAPETFFSIDGGATKVADWSINSPADFLDPPNNNLTPNDPFNEFIDPGSLTS